MIVRRAAAADVPAIARLAAQLGGAVETSRMPARLARILELPTHAVFVAEPDATDAGAGTQAAPCGFAAAEHRLLLPFDEWVELTSLVVDDALRRRGVGTQLVAAVEAWAGRRGVPRIVVRSSITRDLAHDFYPRLGYARLKTQHVYTHDLSAHGAPGQAGASDGTSGAAGEA